MTHLILELMKRGYEVNFQPIKHLPKVIGITLRKDEYVYRKLVSREETFTQPEEVLAWTLGGMAREFEIFSVKEKSNGN